METKQKQSTYVEMVNLLEEAISNKHLSNEKQTRLNQLLDLLSTTSLLDRWNKKKRKTLSQLLRKGIEEGVFDEKGKTKAAVLGALKFAPECESKLKKTRGGAAIGLAGVGGVACGGYGVGSKSTKKTQEKEKESVVSSKPESKSGKRIRELLPHLYQLMMELNESTFPTLSTIAKAADEIIDFDYEELTLSETHKLELVLYTLITRWKKRVFDKDLKERLLYVIEVYSMLVRLIIESVPEVLGNPFLIERKKAITHRYKKLVDEIIREDQGSMKIVTTKSNTTIVHTCVVDVKAVIKAYKGFLEENFTEEAMKVCPNKRKVGGLLREKLEIIEAYASLIPANILNHCNMFTHTQCPIESDGWSYTHQHDWLEKNVFVVIEACEKLLLNHKSQEKSSGLSPERELVLERLKNASDVALKYLVWLLQGLREILLRLGGEQVLLSYGEGIMV